jgi:hypothetical protein
MPLHKRMSGLRRLGMLSTFLMFPAILFGAPPALQTQYSSSGNDLTLTVTGKQLPQLKRITLTFTYNPLGVNTVNAIVSSPLPSTALGALLDTANHTLVLNIIATSNVTVGDGASILVMRAPWVQNVAAAQALQLISAKGIDKNGVEFTPALDISSVLSPRNGTVSAAPTLQTPLFFTRVLINGRLCNNMTATGVTIGKKEPIIFLNSLPLVKPALSYR